MYRASIVAGKLTRIASKAINKNGSNFPGVVARKIDKNILKKISKNTNKIVFITGTNGKTTISHILAHILKTNGFNIVHNAEGSNMITGVTTAFINKHKFFKNNENDIAVIEIDEGSINNVAKEIKPDLIVFSNFFKDQLDRYGSIEKLMRKIENAIKHTEAKLIINADDPHSSKLSSTGLNSVYYGLAKQAFSFVQFESQEPTDCPVCKNELVYSHTHYSKIGHYHCSCGFDRQTPRYEVISMNYEKDIQLNTNCGVFKAPIQGSFNAYNILAAISASFELGLTKEQIQNSLSSLKMENGRMEKFDLKNNEIVLNLAKNAAGINATISESSYRNEPKQFMFILNDSVYDGKDLFWVVEADYDKINDNNTKKIICSGAKASVLAEHLKSIGFDEKKIIIIKNLNDALDELTKKSYLSYVIPNYTALTPIRNLLTKRADSR